MALNVGELSAILDLDDSKFDRKMDNADSKTGRLGEGMKKAAVVGAAAMVTAGVAAAGFGYKAVMSASSLNEAMSKTDNVFKDSAAGIHKWAQGAAKDFGQSANQAEQAAGTFGNLFVQLGIGTDKAADMSMQMTELASDFASFHDADISEVIGAQTAAFRGEYDALQRFVPTINGAAVEMEAMRQTGKKTTKELTAQEKALAVNTLMMKGAGDAAGDFDRTNDSLANRMRTAQAATEDFTSRIGSKLLPVVLDAWDAFDRFSPVIGKVFTGAVEDATRVVGPMADTVRGFFDGAGNYSVSEAFQWGQAEEDMSRFQTAVATAGGMFKATFGEPGNYSVAEAFQWGRAEEDMNSYQTVVAQIGGVFRTATESISSIFGNLQEIVGTFYGTIEEWTAKNEDKFTEWRTKLSEIFTQITEVVSLAWEAIAVVFDVATGIVTNLWDRFGSHLINHLATAFDAILQILGGVFSVISGIFNVFIGIFTGDWTRAWEGVKDIFGGLWDVIVGVARFAINLVSTVIGAGMAVISAAWGYLWRGIQGVFAAVWDGIVSYVTFQVNTVVAIVRGIGSLVSGAASGAFDGIKSAFRSAINWIIEKWNGLSFGIPAIDVPGVGKVGGASVDTPNLPYLAKGGTAIGAGLAVVGEEGPEILAMNRGASVIPLDRMGQNSGPQVVIESIEIIGVRDSQDVVRVLPELQSALAAGVGRNR